MSETEAAWPSVLPSPLYSRASQSNPSIIMMICAHPLFAVRRPLFDESTTPAAGKQQQQLMASPNCTPFALLGRFPYLAVGRDDPNHQGQGKHDRGKHNPLLVVFCCHPNQNQPIPPVPI